MFNNKEPFNHNDAWSATSSVDFRINGKSYTRNQTYSYCHSKFVKKLGLSMIKDEVDIEKKVIMLFVYDRKNDKKEWISIPFKEFVEANNNREPVYLSYKDREYTKNDLNLIAYDYIKRTYHGLFTSYRVSHKTEELVIKYRDGSFFEKTAKIPLDSMEKDLLRIINYKKY